jgi:hypothetical protein
MTPEHWKRICAILDRVLDAPAEVRAGALADACREEGIDVADAEPFLVDETRYSTFLSDMRLSNHWVPVAWARCIARAI